MVADAPKRTKRLGPGKVEYDGEVFYLVPTAARLLKTNVTDVKKLMGTGELEWQNFRVNGPIYISQASVRRWQEKCLAAMRKEHAAKKGRRRKTDEIS
jgi:hypothetical protein